MLPSNVPSCRGSLPDSRKGVMLPTFIVIGGRKCGSTSLCDLLGQHPNVFMTRPKEPHYFSRTASFEPARGEYEALYGDANGHTARGEGSTTYTHPQRIDFAAPRIRKLIPDCRLVYIVRHPIRRLESDWKMRRREGRSSSDINRAVESDKTLRPYGLYWQHLSTYRELFSDEQILVVFLEDLSRDPTGVLARVLAHIGVDPTFAPEDVHRPRNAACDDRRDTVISANLDRLPGYDRVRRAAPRRIVRMARAMLTRAYNDAAVWNPAVLRDVAETYSDDSRRLLEHCGKSKDYWRLEH